MIADGLTNALIFDFRGLSPINTSTIPIARIIVPVYGTPTFCIFAFAREGQNVPNFLPPTANTNTRADQDAIGCSGGPRGRVAVPFAAGDGVTLNLLPDQFDVSLGTRFGACQMRRCVSKELFVNTCFSVFQFFFSSYTF